MSENEQLKLCEEAVALASGTREKILTLCEKLDVIYEERAFENSHTGGEDNFIEELGMSSGYVSKLRKIGRVLIREYQLTASSLSESRSIEGLYIAASAPSKEEAVELVEKSKTLSFKDLRLTANKSDECKHKWTTVKLRCCDNCGLREAVDK